MSDWNTAIPAGFYLEKDKPGRVYRAATKGPPMQIKECEDWDYGNGIAVEYEDMEKRALKEMFDQDVDPSVRLLLQVRDARYLTVALIEALSTGGDVVAKRLKAVMNEVYEEGPPDGEI